MKITSKFEITFKKKVYIISSSCLFLQAMKLMLGTRKVFYTNMYGPISICD